MNLPKIVCRVVGHDYSSGICNRCGKKNNYWKINNALSSSSGLLKIAKAMASPLKVPLDYKGIGRKLFKVDNLPSDEPPVYDKDL